MEAGRLPVRLAIPANLNEPELPLLTLLLQEAVPDLHDPTGFAQFDRLLQRLLRGRITLTYSGVTGDIIPGSYALNRENSSETIVPYTRRSTINHRRLNLVEYYRRIFRYIIRFPHLSTVQDAAMIDHPLEVLWVRVRIPALLPEAALLPGHRIGRAQWRLIHENNYGRIERRRLQQQNREDRDREPSPGPVLDRHLRMERIPALPIVENVLRRDRRRNHRRPRQNQVPADPAPVLHRAPDAVAIVRPPRIARPLPEPEEVHFEWDD